MIRMLLNDMWEVALQLHNTSRDRYVRGYFDGLAHAITFMTANQINQSYRCFKWDERTKLK